MKVLIAKGLVAAASWWLDDTVEVAKLYGWMRTAAKNLAEDAGISERARRDLAQANRLVTADSSVADWPTSIEAHDTSDHEPSLDDSLAWMNGLEGKPAIVKGVLAVGAGEHLGTLSQHRDRAGVDDFVWLSLDRILRHVEVKRSACLEKTAPTHSTERVTLERLDTAILFSRVAKRDNDIRFLNAALKLNDWSFKPCAYGSDDVRARYLLSLAEQESAAKEMLS